MAPLAVTSDGALLVNAAHLYGGATAGELLKRALADGATVFVGVVLDDGDRKVAVARMTEAAGETAAWVCGGRQRRRRPSKRIRRKTVS
jgi:hypothetical protein